MYQAFYGFTEEPFRLSPDVRFCFTHRSFAKAQAYFKYALQRGEGFVVITGQPGTGKTTLIDALLADLTPLRISTVRIEGFEVEAEDLLRRVSYALGLEARGLDKATLLEKLERCLEERSHQHGRVLLVVDEAQALPGGALEALRLITNLRADRHPAAQIFLVGQEALKDLIRTPAMEQLRQRILCSCHLDPLSLDEMRDYVAHRLRLAGWRGDPIIEADALREIHLASQGIPRLINKLTDRLLLFGSLDKLHRLGAAAAGAVLAELRDELLIGSAELPDPSLGPGSAQGKPIAAIALEESPELPREGQDQRWREPFDEVANGPEGVDEAMPSGAGSGTPGHPAAAPIPRGMDEGQLSGGSRQLADETAFARSDADRASTPQRRRARLEWALIALLTLSLGGTVLMLQPDWARSEIDGYWLQLKAWLTELTQPVSLPTSPEQVGPTGMPPAAPGPLTDRPSSERPGPAPEMRDPASRSLPGATTSGATLSAPPSPVETERPATDEPLDPDASTRIASGPTPVTAMDEPSRPQPEASPASEIEPDIESIEHAVIGLVDSADRPVVSSPPVPSRPDPVTRETTQVEPAEPTPEPTDEPVREGEADSAPTPLEPRSEPSAILALQEELQRLGFDPRRTDEGLQINLRNTLVFRFDSATVPPQAEPMLGRLAGLLRRFGTTSVQIIGHTDDVGDAAYNRDLSVRRARALKDYLVDQGIDPDRMIAIGRGEEAPLVPLDAMGAGMEERLENRRIELLIADSAE